MSILCEWCQLPSSEDTTDAELNCLNTVISRRLKQFVVQFFKSWMLEYWCSVLSSKASQCQPHSIMYSVHVWLNAGQLAFCTLKLKKYSQQLFGWFMVQFVKINVWSLENMAVSVVILFLADCVCEMNNAGMCGRIHYAMSQPFSALHW